MSKKGENIYKRKDGRWEARYIKGYAANGCARYGYCYAKSYREAREKVNAARAAMLGCITGMQSERGKCLGIYCDEWLQLKRSAVKGSTYAKYFTIITKHIQPQLGGYPLRTLTPLLVEQFGYDLVHRDALCVKTAKDILTVLHAVLRYAKKRSPELQAIDAVYPKAEKKEMRVLSREEQERFMQYLLQDTDGCKFGTLLTLLTGLRIGEVCALRWKDISLNAATVFVRGTMQRIKSFADTDELAAAIASATADAPVVVEIRSANAYAGLVKISNSKTNFKNTIIKLMTDVDLNDNFIRQIGAGYFFAGTFDGNNHTIKNYNGDFVTNSAGGNRGIFGVLNGGTVKNLTIEDADLANWDTGGVGLIAGCTTSEGAMAGVPVTVENVHIKNSIVRRCNPDEGWQNIKAALFFGNVNGKADVVIKGCTIENSAVVTSGNKLPLNAWYGRNEKNGWTPTVENSTLTNVVVGSIYGTTYDAKTVSLEDILDGTVVLNTTL